MAEYLGPEKCLEKKKKYIMPCLGHFFTNPPQFVKGSMQYLYDHTGKNISTALPAYPLSTAATAIQKSPTKWQNRCRRFSMSATFT